MFLHLDEKANLMRMIIFKTGILAVVDRSNGFDDDGLGI